VEMEKSKPGRGKTDPAFGLMLAGPASQPLPNVKFMRQVLGPGLQPMHLQDAQGIPAEANQCFPPFSCRDCEASVILG